MIEALIAALKAEFTGDVAFHEYVPTTFHPPQIVVAPGDPFLEPSTHGTVLERWDILVLHNTTAPDRNVNQMRDNSLRVMKACHSVGAIWQSTSGPRKATASEGDTTALVQNNVYFRYQPESE